VTAADFDNEFKGKPLDGQRGQVIPILEFLVKPHRKSHSGARRIFQGAIDRERVRFEVC
jgi:hypothetical protein